jgi:hypothetical protein
MSLRSCGLLVSALRRTPFPIIFDALVTQSVLQRPPMPYAMTDQSVRDFVVRLGATVAFGQGLNGESEISRMRASYLLCGEAGG